MTSQIQMKVTRLITEEGNGSHQRRITAIDWRIHIPPMQPYAQMYIDLIRSVDKVTARLYGEYQTVGEWGSTSHTPELVIEKSATSEIAPTDGADDALYLAMELIRIGVSDAELMQRAGNHALAAYNEDRKETQP